MLIGRRKLMQKNSPHFLHEPWLAGEGRRTPIYLLFQALARRSGAVLRAKDTPEEIGGLSQDTCSSNGVRRILQRFDYRGKYLVALHTQSSFVVKEELAGVGGGIYF